LKTSSSKTQEMESSLREMGACIPPQDITFMEGPDVIVGKGGGGVVKKGLW
jgi:hypothetical protein